MQWDAELIMPQKINSTKYCWLCQFVDESYQPRSSNHKTLWILITYFFIESLFKGYKWWNIFKPRIHQHVIKAIWTWKRRGMPNQIVDTRLPNLCTFRIGNNDITNCFKYFTMSLEKEHFPSCKFPVSVGHIAQHW